MDIRILQICAMSTFLIVGVLVGDFSIHWQQVLLTFLSGVLTQALWIKKLKISHIGFLSCCITCLGLSLLLRSDNFYVHPLIAAIAISSKFLLRWREDHIFNPAAFGIVSALLLLPGAWVSPGQWGFTLEVSLFLLAWGLMIATNAKRGTLALKFLIFYLAGLFLRDFWLGWEFDVSWHKFLNGSLILFTFFMITDPKTSPNRPVAQTFYTLSVASLTLILQYKWYVNNAFIFALCLLNPIVLILRQMTKDIAYKWSGEEVPC